jgi:hypothetical protein
MDPPTESRANGLYLKVLDDLEAVKVADGVARDAVLLRISDNVGELARLAERADGAPTHEGSWRQQIPVWVAKISWELVKILSDTDFYTLQVLTGDTNAKRPDSHPRPGSETNQGCVWAVAA